MASFNSHELVLDNVSNFKHLMKKVTTTRIFNKDGSPFSNLSLIKPRPENLSTNLVVKPVKFIPKTISVDGKNDSDIECLGIFPCISESNQSSHNTTYLKKRESDVHQSEMIKNPHEVLLSEQKLIPDVFHEKKAMQNNSLPWTNIDILMKSSVGMTICDAKNNHSTVTPIKNCSVENFAKKTNFGANLKREVRYIDLPAKKRSLDLELKKTPTTSSQIISASKANLTVNITETCTASEMPVIATGKIVKLLTCSDPSIQSIPQVVSQNSANISPKPITRHVDIIKPKLNNTVVIENKHKIGEILVHQNHEIKEQPPKKISAEKETQTDIYCWLFKNDNLYTVDSDEANCVNYSVVPIETALITPLFSETNNIKEIKSPDEKGASKDLLKEDYLDFHQNMTTKENSYPLMSTIHPKDLTDCFQTTFIQDQKSDQYAAKTHFSYTDNSFVNNTNQTYESIQNDKQLKTNKDMMKFPPSVTKLFNKICADIHSCHLQDAYGNMPLHQAVIDNHINRLKSQCIILKTIGSHLDHLNSDEETALMIAMKLAVEDKSSSYEAVSLLVREGADQSVVDMEGYFPLLYAVKHGNKQLVNILLSARDAHKVIEKFGHEGFAPLHLAAIGGMHEIVQLLMTSGANVNVKDRKTGRTPYFHAAEKGHIKAVAVLLAFKADTYEPNLAGQLPPTLKTTRLNQLIHSSPKNHKSIVELDYFNKVEISPSINSIISPCESIKKQKLSEDGNPLCNLTNFEKVKNDNQLKADNFVPVNHFDGIGSIKSCSRINELDTHSSSLKNNLNTSSEKQLLSTKLLPQPKVFKLLKPNPIVSTELVNEKAEQGGDLVIQKTAKGTRSEELWDVPTGIIKTILPVPSKTVEKLSASEDLKKLPNILLTRNTILCKQNYKKKPSSVIKKDSSKKQAQKYTLANFFSRFDNETSNSAENNTNERTEKESKNDSNKKTSCAPESNDNITTNGSNNCDKKTTSVKPGNNVNENTFNLYGGKEIPSSVLDDPTNNLEISNLEIELNSSKTEIKSASEEGLIQNVNVESSDLEREKIKNTNNHCMVNEECQSIERFSETTECTIVEPVDEIEFRELDVVNGKQIESLDLDSNIDASSDVISDFSYTCKNRDIMCSNKNASYESEIVGNNNVQLTFNTYLDTVVNQSIKSNIYNNDISNGDETFSKISKVNYDGLQQRISVGRPRKRSSSQLKPEAKNMPNEMSSTPQTRKRTKKL